MPVASQLMAAPIPEVYPPAAHDTADPHTTTDYRPPCPCCAGRMIIVEVFARGGAPRGPPSSAIITQLVNRSATADFRAIKILLDIVRDIERQTELTTPEISDFSEADEKVLEQIKVRFSIGKPEQ